MADESASTNVRALPIGDSTEGGPDSLLDSTAPQASVHGE